MKKIYRVLLNDKVVGVFDESRYANDFVAYQQMISDETFEIEIVSLQDWLLQPRDF